MPLSLGQDGDLGSVPQIHILAAMPQVFSPSSHQTDLKPMGLHSDATPGWLKDSSRTQLPGQPPARMSLSEPIFSAVQWGVRRRAEMSHRGQALAGIWTQQQCEGTAVGGTSKEETIRIVKIPKGGTFAAKCNQWVMMVDNDNKGKLQKPSDMDPTIGPTL